jgi:predicted RND superfamily exporter protein
MTADLHTAQAMPVVSDPAAFDRGSGSWLERFIFNHRFAVVALCALVTLVLALQALKLPVNASFEKMIPRSHPYIQNYLQHRDALHGMGSSVRIVVEHAQGDIFDAGYLDVLRRITDTAYLIPGVDRAWMRGLWTSSLRWTEVTEEGFRGGPVMPDPWDGTPAALQALKLNIARAGVAGSFVGNDSRSSLILLPLMDVDPQTREPLDYARFSRTLQERLAPFETPAVKLHVVGFARIVGELIAGLHQVMGFFALAVLIAAGLVFGHTRCLRSTLLLVASALLGVVWLLGVLQLLGQVLDPYSILVPFLIFAIGLSHGAQKMNGIMQDIGRGTHKYVAARYTFRRLFLAGLTALLTNVVGFAVLMVIDIPVIQDLAIATSLGVAILIFTKLVLVPVALSYTGVSPRAALRSVRHESAAAAAAPAGGAVDAEGDGGTNAAGTAQSSTSATPAMSSTPAMSATPATPATSATSATSAAPAGAADTSLWRFFASFTHRRRATQAVVVSALLAAAGFAVSLHLQTGDLDAGAPELRADSRYNRDAAYVTAHYALSSDLFVTMLVTPRDGCKEYATLVEADRLGALLREVSGVQATASMADGVRQYMAGQFEGNPRWMSLSRNPGNLHQARDWILSDRPELVDGACSVTPVVAYLADHKADTLARVLAAVEGFARENDTPQRRFLPAAGSAGIEAVTNIVVRQAQTRMLLLLYAAVVLLCFITFRSWRAVLVAVIPLLITSVLCEALMVVLGIGVKVATLPVSALGVGVGVDYALYLLSVQLALQRQGVPLAEAYRQALQFTGRVVALVGITLAAGVMTWAASPIKFQADMGLLLTFMFLWNMLGALILIPALSHFLLGDAAAPAPDALPAAQQDAFADATAGGQVRPAGTTAMGPRVRANHDAAIG